MHGRVRVHNVGRVRNEWSLSSWLSLGIEVEYVWMGSRTKVSQPGDQVVSRTLFLSVVFDAIQSEVLPTLHRQILGVSLICPYRN